jgi:hypothetical protein
MKKIFSILLSLTLLTMILSACGHNRVYGTVVVTPEKYQQIKSDKALIEKSINGLKKFNSENPETEKAVIKSLNAVIKKGQAHMTNADQKQFKELLGEKRNGVKGMVKNAYDHQRGFDDDLSGRIRSNMLDAIKLMTHGITKNKTEQAKVYKQILKDTKADDELYQIADNE